MLQENQLFANRYRLVKRLGQGAFSEVWKAEDTKAGNILVALKVYAPDKGLDEDGAKVFSDEFAIVFNVHHSNLLTPNYFDEENNSPYLVLPFCEQGSSLKLVGKMDERQVAKFLRDVASALAYLHESEIVHQDIKPDNVLIDAKGNFLVTDFGISTRIRSTLRRSVGDKKSAGTMAYMGPERFGRNPKPIKASDVWSLGATVYELMSGDVPFGDMGGGMQTAGAIVPELEGNYSAELKQLVEQCLSKETWDRPTAAQLRDITDHYLRTGAWDLSVLGKGGVQEPEIPEKPKEPVGRKTERRVREIAKEPELLRKDISARYETGEPKVKEEENSGRRKWLPWVIGGVAVIVATVMFLIAYYDSYDGYLVTFILFEYFIFSSISLMFIMKIRKMLPWILVTVVSLAMGAVCLFGLGFWAGGLEDSLLILLLFFGLLSLIMAFIAKKTFPVKVIDEGLIGWRKMILWYTGLTSFILVAADSLLYYYYFTIVVIYILGFLSLIFGIISFIYALKEKKLLWWVVGGIVVSVFGLVLSLNRPTAVDVRSEEYTVNGVSFKMIHVEGGTFQMGATPEQGSDAREDEKPVHSVTVSDFCIGETEVTQALWKAVMGSEPIDYEGYGWTNEQGRGDSYPAYLVSWDECQEFIKKLNQLTGKTFRLPTEAEWEYAARGGNKSKDYKYAGSNSLRVVGWYWFNNGARSFLMKNKVKMKMSNEIGLYDMSGNVEEWCEDFYGNYYSSSQLNPTGPSIGSERVLRGGSTGELEGKCRVSSRNHESSNWNGYYQGLRLVLVQ